MKMLPSIVLIVVVFTVDCHVLPDGYESADRPAEGYKSADGPEGHISADVPKSNFSDLFEKERESRHYLTCPEGFFPGDYYYGICTKIFKDRTRNWHEAKQKCESEGLEMATGIAWWTQHFSPMYLRKQVVTKYGNGWVWLGARDSDDGSGFKWQNGLVMEENRYWYPGQPNRAGNKKCLASAATESAMNQYPNQPYYALDCSYPWIYALCETWGEY